MCEGQTEQAFVREVLGPYASTRGVFLNAPLLGEVGHKGGFVEWKRVQGDLGKLLRQRPNTRVTTLIDLYGIGGTLIALAGGSFPSASARADAIQEAVAEAFDRTPRLIPYVQVHEFETLLFADLKAFEEGTGHEGAVEALAVPGVAPEDINGKWPPSKRILDRFPAYDKVNDGLLAAQEIGVPTMRAAWPRFDGWLAKLGL